VEKGTISLPERVEAVVAVYELQWPWEHDTTCRCGNSITVLEKEEYGWKLINISSR